MTDLHVRRSGDDYGTALLALLPQGQAWPRDPGSTLDLTCRGLAHYWGDVDRRAADLLEQESDPRKTIELLPDWERNWGLPDPCYQEPLTITERQHALVQRMTIEGAQSRQFFIDVAASIGYTITISEYRPFVVGLDRCGDNRVYGYVAPRHAWFRTSRNECGVDPHCLIILEEQYNVPPGGKIPIMYNEWGWPVLNCRGVPVTNGELSCWPNYGFGPPANRFYWTVHVDKAKLTWFRCSSGQTGVDPHLRIGYADDLECLLNRWKPAHTVIVFDYSAQQTPEDIFKWFRVGGGGGHTGVDPHLLIVLAGINPDPGDDVLRPIIPGFGDE